MSTHPKNTNAHSRKQIAVQEPVSLRPYKEAWNAIIKSNEIKFNTSKIANKNKQKKNHGTISCFSALHLTWFRKLPFCTGFGIVKGTD